MTFYAPLRDVTVTAVGVTNMQTAFLRAGVFWVVCIIITILINSAYDIVWIGGIGGSLLVRVPQVVALRQSTAFTTPLSSLPIPW